MSNKQTEIYNEAKLEGHVVKKQPKEVPYKYHQIHTGKFGAMTQEEHDLWLEVREDRI